jgi:ubiquinol-cytochrome c reductase cytochrome c1 subunit
MKKRVILGLLLACGLFDAASASEDVKQPIQKQWQFDGALGYVDKPSAQRGFQVYKEVCAACHGLKRIAFRNLVDLGFSEAEVKSLAASYQVKDGPNDEGEMFERAGRPSDRLLSPYENEQQARSLNNGAYPPDMSLIFKARPDGGNYIYSLLSGYEPAPEGVELLEGQYYNPYMAGGKIAMPAPLTDGQVTYQDGTEASVAQMSVDVVNFLQWASEPEMQQRKTMGFKVMGFLAVMTLVFYIAKRRIWKDLH